MKELSEYQRILFKLKLCMQMTELRSGGKVQEVTIADTTGHAALHIWEEHLGKIKKDAALK